jgi:hypothetical protein
MTCLQTLISLSSLKTYAFLGCSIIDFIVFAFSQVNVGDAFSEGVIICLQWRAVVKVLLCQEVYVALFPCALGSDE